MEAPKYPDWYGLRDLNPLPVYYNCKLSKYITEATSTAINKKWEIEVLT